MGNRKKRIPLTLHRRNKPNQLIGYVDVGEDDGEVTVEGVIVNTSAGAKVAAELMKGTLDSISLGPFIDSKKKD